MALALPFRLKVSGKDEFRGIEAVSTSFRFHGVVRLAGDDVTLEWAGEARIQEVGALTVRDDRLPLPEESLTLSVDRLHAVTLAGGWWRPRLELVAGELGALASVPSEDGGQVRLWYARRDRDAARALAGALSRAIAAAARRGPPRLNTPR